MPFVRPVKVWLVAPDAFTQVVPLSRDTWYPVIALPPLLNGAAHAIETRPLPGCTLKLRGTNGAVAGATGVPGTPADKLAPTLFIARTLKLYDVPLVSPVKVWLVMLDAFTQDTPLFCDT